MWNLFPVFYKNQDDFRWIWLWAKMRPIHCYKCRTASMFQDQLLQTRYRRLGSKLKIWLRSVRFNFSLSIWFSAKIFLHAFIFNSVIIMVCLQTVWRFGFVNKLNEIVERGKLIETLVWEQSTTYRIEYMSVSFSIGSAQILQPSVFRNFQKRSPKMRILEQFFFYNQLHQENQFDQLSML